MLSSVQAKNEAGTGKYNFSQGGVGLSYDFKDDIVLGMEEDFYVLLIKTSLG